MDRIPWQFRAELEGLWASGGKPPLLGRDEVYEFTAGNGIYVMLAQLPDTTFVAVRLDPAEDYVRRIEPDGSSVRNYPSITAALSG